jgi:hypothetical protein
MALIKIQRFFGAVPNELLNNPDISFKAKGLYAYLNSKPDNWDFSVESIANQVKEGIDSVRAGIHELEHFGYLKRIKYQNEKGYWEVDYMLFETPVQDEAYQGKSNEGEHPKQYKKDNTKKEFIKKEVIPPLSPKGENVRIDYKGLDKAVAEWLEYKAEKRQKYSGPKSTQTMINRLWKLSNGNPEKAMEIVLYSMSGNYQGLFLPRENNFAAASQKPSPPRKSKVKYYDTDFPDRVRVATREEYNLLVSGNPDSTFVITQEYFD